MAPIIAGLLLAHFIAAGAGLTAYRMGFVTKPTAVLRVILLLRDLHEPQRATHPPHRRLPHRPPTRRHPRRQLPQPRGMRRGWWQKITDQPLCTSSYCREAMEHALSGFKLTQLPERSGSLSAAVPHHAELGRC